MDSIRHIGLDLHRDTISAAVLETDGTLMMQSVLATRAAAIIDFLQWDQRHTARHLRECKHSAWLYDLLARRVAEVVVCDRRKNKLLKSGNKRSDRCPQAGGVVAYPFLISRVSRRNQCSGGPAQGAQLYRTDRGHDSDNESVEGTFPQPGDCVPGRESIPEKTRESYLAQLGSAALLYERVPAAPSETP